MNVQKRITGSVVVIMMALTVSVFAKPKENTEQIADIDPFPVASLAFSTDSLVPGKINQKTFEEIFYARSNEMCVSYSVVPNQYQLFLDKHARDAIIAAARQYIADYENHALTEKKKNNAYGKITTRFAWGGLTISAETHPEIALGYRFVDGAPYFTLNIPDMPDELNASAQVVRRTGAIVLHFTRAQLEAFGETLDNTAIMESVDEVVKTLPDSKPDAY